MTNWEFPVSGPITLDARLPAGHIQITATGTELATVTLRSDSKRGEQLIGETEVTFDAGNLTVSVPERIRLLSSTSLDLAVQLPAGLDRPAPDRFRRRALSWRAGRPGGQIGQRGSAR